jgi:hypothetical protein
MPKPLPALQQTENYPLRRSQDYVRSTFRSLQQATPFLDGVLVGPVAIGTAEVKLDHKLERAPVGYLVLRIDAGAVAVGALLFRAADASTITLAQSAGGTPVSYTLWVF